jgi:peptidylprolyl isomerase
MRKTRLLAAAALSLALAIAASAADPADTRAPVPDAAAKNAATAELKKELADKLKAKDAESRRALARSLLARAADGDPAKRYAVLDLAAQLAEEARDVGLALDAVARLAGEFQVPRAARGLAALESIARGAKEAAVPAEAAAACVELAGEALAADDPAGASKSLAAAKTYAKTAKLNGLVARATELESLVASFKKLSAAAGVGEAALAAAPDDPAGHEAVGRFACFGRARWDEGLPHLAKSGNAALADVAGRDAARSEDFAAKQAVADSWWEAAQKEKDPLARARMLARAAQTYESSKSPTAKERLDAVTFAAWNRGVALTKDFSKDGPAGLALSIIRDFIAAQRIDRKREDWKSKLPRFPDVTFTRGESYVWNLTTNQGAIAIRLFPDTAPNHVANFIYLTELGFYDGSIFHRVIPGFMAQGGSSSTTASMGPGYTFGGEFVGDRKHDKAGVLSMANTGAPNSDASQFFITFVATPNLDGKHTICGEVIDGMDVVRKLEAQGTPEPGTPKTPLVIEVARIALK